MAVAKTMLYPLLMGRRNEARVDPFGRLPYFSCTC